MVSACHNISQSSEGAGLGICRWRGIWKVPKCSYNIYIYIYAIIALFCLFIWITISFSLVLVFKAPSLYLCGMPLTWPISTGLLVYLARPKQNPLSLCLLCLRYKLQLFVREASFTVLACSCFAWSWSLFLQYAYNFSEFACLPSLIIW